jgi:hypothetical protein
VSHRSAPDARRIAREMRNAALSHWGSSQNTLSSHEGGVWGFRLGEPAVALGTPISLILQTQPGFDRHRRSNVALRVRNAMKCNERIARREVDAITLGQLISYVNAADDAPIH